MRIGHIDRRTERPGVNDLSVAFCVPVHVPARGVLLAVGVRGWCRVSEIDDDDLLLRIVGRITSS
jgi:hypothetical protein